MSPQLVSQLATFLLVIPPLVGAPAAIWAIRAIRRPPRADRADRRSAITLALILGALPLVAIPAFFGLLGQAWGGSAGQGIVVGIPIGAGVALAVVLSGLAGYAALARPGRGSSAVVGVLLGPLVLGGGMALAAQAKGMADAAYYRTIYGEAAIEANAREIARVESLLDVRIVDVDVRTVRASGPGGQVRVLVEGLRLTLAVASAERIALSERIGQEPHAWFYPDAALTSGFDVRLGSDRILEIPAGESTFVIEDRWPDLKALAGWPDAPQPGPWTLHFLLSLPGMETGQGVDIEVPFEVPAP
jgi:hypothetical protein